MHTRDSSNERLKEKWSPRSLVLWHHTLIRQFWLITTLSFLCALFSSACFDHRESAEDPPPPPRKPRPRPPFKDDPWFEKYMIEGEGMGLHAKLSLSPGGQLGVAYWSTDGQEGQPCEEIEVDDPPSEVRWSLRFASWESEMGWLSQLVSRPLLLGNPPGLDLDYSSSGQPMVTSIAGEAIPELRYCGGGNLSVFTPSTDPDASEWDVEYVAETSDQAMSGEAASDFGFVVGYWPSQFIARNGSRMIVYQDVHGGSLQRDDLVRADLEVALQTRGGSWSYEVIDLGEGAGIYNQALITEAGQFLALYYISFDAQMAERQRQGIWLARRDESGEWLRGLVFGGPTRGQPSIIAYGEGVAVTYYDPQARRPILALLSDLTQLADSSAWRRIPLGDPRYNEGHSPSMTVLPDGRIGIAWYRCGPAEVEECRPSDDAVVFTYPEALQAMGNNQGEEGQEMGDNEEMEESGTEVTVLDDEALAGPWEIEIVESGEEALCGFSPQVITDRSKRVWVTWQCSRRVGTEGEFEFRLESARRDLFQSL